jgi:hypothetical protein
MSYDVAAPEWRASWNDPEASGIQSRVSGV